MEEKRSILFFDGHCCLCNRLVNVLLMLQQRRSRPGQGILFAPLQGQVAKQLLDPSFIQALDTVVFLKGGQTFAKSAAVLEAVSEIRPIFKTFKLLYFVPELLRNFLYDFIAQKRYAWFGRSDICRLPTPEERHYFLD